MAKEILLYGDVFDVSARNFIKELSDAGDSDVSVRINTNGGDPQAAFGMIAKLLEIKGKTLGKVDGKAYSTGSFILPFFDEVEALNVSEFLIHRAAFPRAFERDFMTEEQKTSLIKLNSDLRAALDKKIDIKKFEVISGKTLEEVFSMDSRIDVRLTAEQAKDIGLVNRIVKITESQIAASSRMLHPDMDAHIDTLANESKSQLGSNASKNKQVKTSNNMDKAKLKLEHPEVYASILEDGKAAGVRAENDRAGSWLAWHHIDPKACKEGIESGDPISQTATAHFQVAAVNANHVEAMANTAAEETPTVETPVATASPEAAEVNKFEAELNKHLA